MGILDIFKRKPELEKRASASGYTSEIMAARESYISGRRGVGELTSTAQACVSLWEGALSTADVSGTTLLTRHHMALAARALALRGECVFLIREDGLVPCSDWDLSTRDGRPRAYRVSISEAGGGSTMTALAAEVLHFRIGSDVSAPWTGTSPLRRASLTAGLLQAIETALAEIYETAPIGTQVLPFPETPDTDLEKLGRSFRGQRGRVLLRESVNVSAAGGPAPAQDWRPSDVTPDLSRAMTKETLAAARHGIMTAFGVLPGMLDPNTTGVMVRESQRHTATWSLEPIAKMMAEEASEKLGIDVEISVMRALQAFDAGARSRAVSQIIGALATAKAAGVDSDDVAKVMNLVDWQGAD